MINEYKVLYNSSFINKSLIFFKKHLVLFNSLTYEFYYLLVWLNAMWYSWLRSFQENLIESTKKSVNQIIFSFKMIFYNLLQVFTRFLNFNYQNKNQTELECHNS